MGTIKNHPVSFRLSNTEYEWFTRAAKKKGVSRSKLMREATKKVLNEAGIYASIVIEDQHK